MYHTRLKLRTCLPGANSSLSPTSLSGWTGSGPTFATSFLNFSPALFRKSSLFGLSGLGPTFAASSWTSLQLFLSKKSSPEHGPVRQFFLTTDPSRKTNCATQSWHTNLFSFQMSRKACDPECLLQSPETPKFPKVRRGCKRCFGQLQKGSLKRLVCTSATLSCTNLTGFWSTCTKTPFAPSPNHFGAFWGFGVL